MIPDKNNKATKTSPAHHKADESNMDDQLLQVWQVLKKEKQGLIQFEKEMNALVDYYHKSILPQERAILLAPSCDLIEHLTPFLTQDGLDETQRKSLLQWLESLIGNVALLDNSLAKMLKERLTEVINQFQCHSQSQSSHRQERVTHQILMNSVNEQFYESENAAQPGHPKWLSTIFRKTAQAIHPDREPNPNLIQQKAALMTRLIKARKTNDSLTVLELYMEHVNRKQFLGDNEKYQMVEFMQRQLALVKDRRHACVFESPIRALAYDRLYASTRKQVKENVQRTLEHFYEVRRSLLYCRKKIKDTANVVDFLCNP